MASTISNELKALRNKCNLIDQFGVFDNTKRSCVQTNRQTGRQTERQTERKTDRHRDRWMDSKIVRQTNWQIDRQTARQTGRYRKRHIGDHDSIVSIIHTEQEYIVIIESSAPPYVIHIYSKAVYPLLSTFKVRRVK